MSRRILAMTIEDFRSADSGSRIRDYHLCSTLAEFGSLDVLTFEPSGTVAGPRRPFDGNLLIDKPKPLTTSAVDSVLRRRQIHASRFDPTAHRDFVACASRHYDLIYCSILYSVPAAARLAGAGPSAGSPVLWDTQNFDPDVFRAMANGSWGLRSLAGSTQIRLAERATVAAAADATFVVACTQQDADKFSTYHDNVRIVPNATEVDDWWQAGAAQAPTPYTVVVFGSLQRDSTWRGIKWMISDVWPLVQQAEPRSELIIAGRDPSQQLRSLITRTSGVRLVANPTDIRPVVCGAQVVAVPETWGTGSKLKMAEALASTRPVVATTAATTGLDEHLSRYIREADTAEAFAAGIVASYDVGRQTPDAALLAELNKRADWAASRADLRKIVDDALNHRSE